MMTSFKIFVSFHAPRKRDYTIVLSLKEKAGMKDNLGWKTVKSQLSLFRGGGGA